jgi:hypothetical protein
LNTSQIGDISQAAVMTALLKAGKSVLVPWGDRERYDLVVDDNGSFSRIQAKTGRVTPDGAAVVFRTCNYVNGRYEHYTGQIESFGVYCPELETVYIVPIGVTGRTHCKIRLIPAKNGQRIGVRMAEDYLISTG